MAQQDSLIKLKGKIGDLTFFKSKNGYQAIKRQGVSGSRIASDAAFERTRENNAEFARAANSAKKLRDVLRSVILQTSDPKMGNRLNGRIMRILKADNVNQRGQRKVLTENIIGLKDFGFNAAAQLNATAFMPYTVDISQSLGSCSISLPAFDPRTWIFNPKGATHFKLSAAAALVDFEGDASEIKVSETAELLLNEESPATVLPMELSAASALPLLLLFGVSFYQMVNDVFYPLNNGAFNALNIVAITLP